MAGGELVFANVVDARVYSDQGADGPAGVYLVGVPGRALPFVVHRAWKAPVGFVSEEFRLIAPSGHLAYRWGPEVRRMHGAMDLTVEAETITDAVLDETGPYVASFILDEWLLGEIDLPVHLQEGTAALPKAVEDGLKRSDVIWVGVEENGNDQTIPAWFVYRQGKIFLLSQRRQLKDAPPEQAVPGLPRSSDLVVVTRRKGRETSLDRFHAVVRVLEGEEWEKAAALLADRRRDRHGPPGEAIERWRDTCDIAELTPVVAA
ncbi:MAG: hypothetical protein ABR600_03565 [Actinomycetota bacterium]